MAAWNMKLAGKRRHPLPRHHPLYSRKLELSGEHTALAFGHRSLLENCPLFWCLVLGVHSIVTGDHEAPRARNVGWVELLRNPSDRDPGDGFGGACPWACRRQDPRAQPILRAGAHPAAL